MTKRSGIGQVIMEVYFACYLKLPTLLPSIQRDLGNAFKPFVQLLSVLLLLLLLLLLRLLLLRLWQDRKSMRFV